MNRPLGFLCFLLVFGGLFVIFGVQIIVFLSIQTLAYVRVPMSGPKERNCWSLDTSASFHDTKF